MRQIRACSAFNRACVDVEYLYECRYSVRYSTQSSVSEGVRCLVHVYDQSRLPGNLAGAVEATVSCQFDSYSVLAVSSERMFDLALNGLNQLANLRSRMTSLTVPELPVRGAMTQCRSAVGACRLRGVADPRWYRITMVELP